MWEAQRNCANDTKAHKTAGFSPLLRLHQSIRVFSVKRSFGMASPFILGNATSAQLGGDAAGTSQVVRLILGQWELPVITLQVMWHG
jgi:hypothetical protein